MEGKKFENHKNVEQEIKINEMTLRHAATYVETRRNTLLSEPETETDLLEILNNLHGALAQYNYVDETSKGQTSEYLDSNYFKIDIENLSEKIHLQSAKLKSLYPLEHKRMTEVVEKLTNIQ